MNDQFSSNYNLAERTAQFGQSVILFCQDIKQDAITRPLISQLVRSATSIGANYAEANNASSKKDFRNKIFICKKEAQETKHWSRMIKQSFSGNQDKMLGINKECQELIMIFQKITSSLDK